MEEKIRSAVQEALESVGAPDTQFAIEWPTDLSHGDYATNAAMAAAKALGKNPKELAEELAALMRTSLDFEWKVDVAGPGFINFTAARSVVTEGIQEAAWLGAEWGRGVANEGKRVVVEYSCPNPFKEMHIGHLMSTVIGEALARTIENSGATVIRDSYGGDVGPHVAKALWSLQKDEVTDVANANEVDAAYVKGARAYEESENAKAEIDTLNQEIYKGENQELMNLWRKCREVCLEAFRELYKVLGTSFDYYFFESEAAVPGMEMVRDGLAKGIFEESDGAIIYKGEKKGLHTLVFVTSRGTPTYETKDLGLAVLKEERIPNDLSIIVTAAEQIGHFKVFFAALEDIAPNIAAKTLHFPHGFMRLTSGKMSSREGTTITAASLVTDTIKTVAEKNADPLVAEAVAVAAIKYSILKQAAGGDIIFDMEKSLSTEGDSGPYLQYALVRAKSILAQASDKESEQTEAPAEPYDIERLVIRYPEVAAHAERERAPHHITQYLTQLAGAWNSFYAANRIIGGEHEAYKLAVARAFAQTMENGLKVLGIPTPEKM
jgi:arginyl-tRNA synthetase